MKIMKLTIGNAVGFRRPEDWSYTPDDRQEKHETIDGAVVEDYGHAAVGDVINCTAVFKYPEYLKIYNYWETRTKVKIIDHAGMEWDDMRIVVKKDSYIDRFENYHKLDLEFWRI